GETAHERADRAEMRQQIVELDRQIEQVATREFRTAAQLRQRVLERVRLCFDRRQAESGRVALDAVDGAEELRDLVPELRIRRRLFHENGVHLLERALRIRQERVQLFGRDVEDAHQEIHLRFGRRLRFLQLEAQLHGLGDVRDGDEDVIDLRLGADAL